MHLHHAPPAPLPDLAAESRLWEHRRPSGLGPLPRAPPLTWPLRAQEPAVCSSGWHDHEPQIPRRGHKYIHSAAHGENRADKGSRGCPAPGEQAGPAAPPRSWREGQAPAGPGVSPRGLRPRGLCTCPSARGRQAPGGGIRSTKQMTEDYLLSGRLRMSQEPQRVNSG